MVRVLHLGEKLTIAGGIESFIYNVYKHIDLDLIQFDFLIQEENVDNYYEDLIYNNGGKVYWLKNNNKISQFITKYKVFRNYKNGVIHIHTNCGIRAIDGIIARLAGVKKIIFHSHTSMGIAPFKYRILRPLFRCNSKYLLACSKSAGNYFFGEKGINSKKFFVVNNAIDYYKFINTPENRTYALNEFKIDSTVSIDMPSVIAFIGRLSKEKNVGFFLDIIKELTSYRKIKAIIIGDGEEKNSLENKVKSFGLQDIVLFMGKRDDVNVLMSGIDAVVMPSLYEGLGITLIEAQAAGINCYASDSIPRESDVTGSVKYISLNESKKVWASAINNGLEEVNNKIDRNSIYKSFCESGYMIEDVSKFLQNIYKK